MRDQLNTYERAKPSVRLFPTSGDLESDLGGLATTTSDNATDSSFTQRAPQSICYPDKQLECFALIVGVIFAFFSLFLLGTVLVHFWHARRFQDRAQRHRSRHGIDINAFTIEGSGLGRLQQQQQQQQQPEGRVDGAQLFEDVVNRQQYQTLH